MKQNRLRLMLASSVILASLSIMAEKAAANLFTTSFNVNYGLAGTPYLTGAFTGSLTFDTTTTNYGTAGGNRIFSLDNGAGALAFSIFTRSFSEESDGTKSEIYPRVTVNAKNQVIGIDFASGLNRAFPFITFQVHPDNSFVYAGFGHLWTVPNAVTFAAIPTVPEPDTWVMMIAGFAAVGYALRRRATLTNSVLTG